jgi:ABC-type multidrug transport system fused ATPase/permease subunit
MTSERSASTVLQRIWSSQEWKFFSSLQRADRRLASAWWALLIGRGILPALLAVASGLLVSAVGRHESLTQPLVFVAVVFVALQVLTPLHRAVSSNLGSRLSAWLNDRLMQACTRPQGMAHLERPELTSDLAVARDFDLGIMGPPLAIGMDFIAGGLVELVAGATAGALLLAFTWWAPLLLIAGWGSTHWLLRESGVWRDRNTSEVRDAQRHADYAYRLAVDPPAAKELRLFGLAQWVVDRFAARRQHLYRLRWDATRLRERSVIGCLLVVATANAVVFWAIAVAAADDRVSLGAVVVFLQAAIGTSAIAFGGLSWALDGAAAPVAAVLRLEETMATAGQLTDGGKSAANLPARDIRFRGVTFAYESSDRPVLAKFDLTIPAGTSMAIVGVNGAGKTTLAKLLCRLYDPQEGAIDVDGVDLRDLDLAAWRNRIAAVFQDFVRYELPLRDNVAPDGRAPTQEIEAALRDAGGEGLAALDTVLARAYPGGTELSGGQWQRIALARALCAVRLGAGLVLLDEPTAQLDVRGEAEIFERVLAATRHCTTILVSHRFSTVRQADRICVIDAGKVVELGNHAELMARGGRYATMFELQASRFVEQDEHGEEVVYDTLA